MGRGKYLGSVSGEGIWGGYMGNHIDLFRSLWWISSGGYVIRNSHHLFTGGLSRLPRPPEFVYYFEQNIYTTYKAVTKDNLEI